LPPLDSTNEVFCKCSKEIMWSIYEVLCKCSKDVMSSEQDTKQT
jgi:hypothetical protein